MSLEKEPLVPFKELAKEVPTQTGRKINLKAMYRWSAPGVGGVQLETVRVGGRILSSHAALRRFFERLSENAEQRSATSNNNTRRIELKSTTDAARQAGEVLDKVVFKNMSR